MVSIKMKSSYLTKYLSLFVLIVNLSLTLLFWFYIIGTNDTWWIALIQSYAMIDVNTAEIITTVLCALWAVKSITAYETRVVQFIQADLLKEILMVLKSSEKTKRIDAVNDDALIDFSRIKD